jgi:hypothetical protein
MTSYFENYKPEELETERQLCVSLFDIPHPNEITGVRQIITCIKEFNEKFLSKCSIHVVFIIVGLDGELIIESSINDILYKFLKIKDKNFKLVYKDTSYINLDSLFKDLDINDETHYLTLVKITKEKFLIYSQEETEFEVRYMIKYYHEKYNIKFIKYSKCLRDGYDIYYYPVVMIAKFFEDCIDENLNANYPLCLRI